MNEKLITANLGDDTRDPIQLIHEEIDKARFFVGNEPGLYHPVTSSLIKLRNNGMIDIFAGTNQGIRIDPKTKSVNFFANNEKHHITNSSTWADGSIEYHVKRKILMQALDIILKATTLTLDAEEISISTSRDKISIGGKTLADTDNEVSSLNENLNVTNNTLNLSVDALHFDINSLRTTIAMLGQRISNLEKAQVEE